MPNTRSMIAKEGAVFTRAFCTTPLCAPSRLSIFTGKYGRHTGVLGNLDPVPPQTTVYDRLRASGYYTGLVGKYLNQFTDTDPLPNFDFVVVHESGDSLYIDPRLNIDGQWQVVSGYITFILRDQVLRFLGQVPQDQPFLLFFTPNAPHAPAIPAPGDENLYTDLPLFRPPNFNEADVSDKPIWLQNTPPLSPSKIKSQVDDLRIHQLQSLNPVDDAVGAILNLLKQQGKLDNTLVVFMSDNGYFWGEHRLTGKYRVYDEATRVPLALRYPPLVPVARTVAELVANIDIAPTLYELAGVPLPADVDGLSLVPRLKGTSPWRDALLLEGKPGPRFQAVRNKHYVYVENKNDRSELYDLQADPYQLNNLVDNPSYADIIKRLRARLSRF
jgi:arylsulfatase A-like enzyme